MKGYAITELNKPLEEITKPTPEPKGREVLIEISYSGVCHTDLHVQEGSYDLGSRGKLNFADRGVVYPVIPGHEIVGKVVSWGADADAAGLNVGDTRLIHPWIGCGDCEHCQVDQQNLCLNMKAVGLNMDGGFASHILVPDYQYLIDIEGIDPALACTYACSGLTVYSAIKKLMPLQPNDAVVVIGAGGLGHNAISMLKALGHHKICVVDNSAEKLKAAEEQGASVIVLAADDGGATTAAIIEACEGRVFKILDTVNASSTAKFAFNAIMKGGKIVQLGLFGGELTIPLPLMPARLTTLQGSMVGGLADIREVISLAKKGLLPSIPISLRPMCEASVALDDLKHGKVTGRVVLVNE